MFNVLHISFQVIRQTFYKLRFFFLKIFLTSLFSIKKMQRRGDFPINKINEKDKNNSRPVGRSRIIISSEFYISSPYLHDFFVVVKKKKRSLDIKTQHWSYFSFQITCLKNLNSCHYKEAYFILPKVLLSLEGTLKYSHKSLAIANVRFFF